MAISIIGLGKLGASMAAAMAKRGEEIIGVDINHHAVDALNAGREPVEETDLGKTIAENKERIRATLDHAEAIAHSDISFVIVPTPSDERGAFSLQYAAWAFKEIGKALAQKDAYHTIVLSSTVLPGSCRYGLIPILEQHSGKKCGEGFGFCYSPEFIALGSVIRDFLNPDFTLVGEYDERSGRAVEEVYSRVMENSPPCRRMTLENAELTKVALNSYVTLKITYANMLADLCERIPGGDIDVVSEALGSDERIGRKYLTGGLGYGGPCFPRDNVALAFLAKELGGVAAIPEMTDQLNRSLAKNTLDKLKAHLIPGMTVAVLGLSYKPASHIVEESQGLAIARTLADRGMRVIGYDPLATETASIELHGHGLVTDSLEECLLNAELAIIANPDPEFKSLSAQQLLAEKDKITVVDFWRILPDEVVANSQINYIPMGKSAENSDASIALQALWKIPQSSPASP